MAAGYIEAARREAQTSAQRLTTWHRCEPMVGYRRDMVEMSTAQDLAMAASVSPFARR
jgi:hypothetical protein